MVSLPKVVVQSLNQPGPRRVPASGGVLRSSRSPWVPAPPPTTGASDVDAVHGRTQLQASLAAAPSTLVRGRRAQQQQPEERALEPDTYYMQHLPELERQYHLHQPLAPSPQAPPLGDPGQDPGQAQEALSSAQDLQDLTLQLEELLSEVQQDVESVCSRPESSVLELSARTERVSTEVVQAMPSPSGLSLLPPAAALAPPQGRGKRTKNWIASRQLEDFGAARPERYKRISQGKDAVGMFVGNFDQSSLLSAEEEQRLTTAAKDYMELVEASNVLASVLKRPPSLAEMATAVQSDSEQQLQQRLECGAKARLVLAQKNYRLVVSVARKYSTSSTATARQDAIAAGMEGLMHGIRKYRPESGYRLSTYVSWWIRQSVARYLRDGTGIIRLPTHLRDSFLKLRKATQALMASNGNVQPSTEELASATGMSPTKVADVLSAIRRAASVLSLDETNSDDERTFGETLQVEDGQPTAEEVAASTSVDEAVEGLLGHLDGREKQLLWSSLTEEDASVRALSYKSKMSVEGVRQVLLRAKRKLKEKSPEELQELVGSRLHDAQLAPRPAPGYGRKDSR